jgi:hypothetical protein
MAILCRIASHQGSACDGDDALVYDSFEYFKGSRKILGANGLSKTFNFKTILMYYRLQSLRIALKTKVSWSIKRTPNQA